MRSQRANAVASCLALHDIQGESSRGDAGLPTIRPPKTEETRYYGAERSPSCAAATLSRVVFLTRYMASSARCSNSALVFASVG